MHVLRRTPAVSRLLLLMRKPLAVVLAWVLLVGASVAAAASLVESRVAALGTRPAKAAAYGEVLAWSAWDARQRRYRLVVRVGDRPARRVSVAGRWLPFDVDVGPDRRGRPLIAYSRCRSEPSPVIRQNIYEGNTDLPRYDLASGCDLFTYSLADGHERRIAGVSSSAESEYLPTIWRGNIAFARRKSATTPPRLYLRRGGVGRSQRLAGGPTRGDPAVDGPATLDLRGTRLAYHWMRLVDNCENPGPDIGAGVLPFEEQIRLVQPGRTARRISPLACSQEDGVSGVRGVTWSGSETVYAVERGLGSERTGTLTARATDGTTRLLGDYAARASARYLTSSPTSFYATFAPPQRRDYRISRLADPLPAP